MKTSQFLLCQEAVQIFQVRNYGVLNSITDHKPHLGRALHSAVAAKKEKIKIT